ncbi:MAG: DUF6922 domain-containing protein [Chloroflexota bacterium]|jgi:hypothetical protein|nr:hypothetical protein [Lentimicrobium sp.]
MASENYISLLSPHLFWDVDLKDIDPELHKQFIVGRVMGYGTISDWRVIQKHLGLEEIGRVAVNINDLDAKSCSFLSLITNIPLKEFKCYTTRQLNPPHWNF